MQASALATVLERDPAQAFVGDFGDGRERICAPSFDAAARLGRSGLLSLTAPRRLGGEEGGFQAALRAIVELAGADPSAALLVSTANFGASSAAFRYADQELARRAAALSAAGAPIQLAHIASTWRTGWRSETGWRISGEARADAMSLRAALLLVRVTAEGAHFPSRVGAASRAAKMFFLIDRDRDHGVVLRHTAQGATLMFDAVEIASSRALSSEKGHLQSAMAIDTLLTTERRLASCAMTLGQAKHRLQHASFKAALSALEDAAKAADETGVVEPWRCSAAYAEVRRRLD